MDRVGHRPLIATEETPPPDANPAARSAGNRRAAAAAPTPALRRPRRAASDAPPAADWDLRLFIAGETPQSKAACANLKRLCEAHLAGKHRIEIVDLLQNPLLAREDGIVAAPTLVRKRPRPVRKIIGDLSDSVRTLVGLQLRGAV